MLSERTFLSIYKRWTNFALGTKYSTQQHKTEDKTFKSETFRTKSWMSRLLFKYLIGTLKQLINKKIILSFTFILNYIYIAQFLFIRETIILQLCCLYYSQTKLSCLKNVILKRQFAQGSTVLDFWLLPSRVEK